MAQKKSISIKKIYFVISLFIRLSLLFAIVRSILTKNYLVLVLSSIVLLITFIPIFFRKKYDFKAPTEIELITVLFIYVTLFLGSAQGFYDKFAWWDILTHTSSAIVFGFIGFTILYLMYSQNKVSAKPLGIAIFAFSFAIAMGTIWEIFEFLIDQTLEWGMQKSGLIDTMWDLIVNTIGAIIASVIGFIYLKTKKTLIFNGIIKKIHKS